MEIVFYGMRKKIHFIIIIKSFVAQKKGEKKEEKKTFLKLNGKGMLTYTFS